MYLWGLCDVEFEGVRPDKCVRYDNYLCLELMLFRCCSYNCKPVGRPPQDALDVCPLSTTRSHLAQAVVDLKKDYNLTLIYYGNIDQMGHEHGPDSKELVAELKK